MLENVCRPRFSLPKNPWLLLIFFAAIATFFRWASFYQSAIDWDESLYLLVANAWLKGNTPYTVIWDNKPPGIYTIFLIALSVFGHAVLSIRVTTILFVAVTCFFLYRIGVLIEPGDRTVGLLSGCLYAALTLDNGGIASNTELFFTTFVVAAYYYFFESILNAQKLPSAFTAKLFVIGLLLGIAFEIKYVVLFDFIALFLILAVGLILRPRGDAKLVSVLPALLILLVGFVLPFIAASIYFISAGHLEEYIYANFTANKLRTINVEFSIPAFLQAINQQIRASLPFWLSIPAIIAYLTISKVKSTQETYILWSSIAWLFIILAGICIVFRGNYYLHYFLHLAPILSLCTAYLVVRLVPPLAPSSSQTARKRLLILTTLVAVLLATTNLPGSLKSSANYIYYRHVKGDSYWGDTPAVVAAYLKPRITPEDYIYMVCDAPIVYFLVNSNIPTRYAFPPFLVLRPDLPNITGVNPLNELDQILQKRPIYIINHGAPENAQYLDDNGAFASKLNQALAKYYRLESSINGFSLYRLIGASPL